MINYSIDLDTYTYHVYHSSVNQNRNALLSIWNSIGDLSKWLKEMTGIS